MARKNQRLLPFLERGREYGVCRGKMTKDQTQKVAVTLEKAQSSEGS